MKTFDNCDWAVCYDVSGATQDDGQPGRTVCGWFSYPFQAQDFIDKVLPPENVERFYIIHREEIRKERERDRRTGAEA